MTLAKIKNAGLGRNVPRIPALRVLGGLEAQGERVDARVEVEWTDDQTRVAQFETPTDGFTLVNASLSWRPLPDTKNLTLMLSANNIFRSEEHTSELQSLMRISYAVFCLKKKKNKREKTHASITHT